MRVRSLLGWLLAAMVAVGLGVALSACGDDAPRAPEPGPYVGQEIWLTYHSPPHERFGRRTGRTKEDAKALADQLRARVLAGEDAGLLAKQHSNAPGAAALGFSFWRAAKKKEAWDVRDEEMVRTPIGGVTAVVDWMGGWWFAKRIPPARGFYLEGIFNHLNRQRARVRAVAVVWHNAAGLSSEDVVPRTREQARQRAEEALRAALSGVDFADVAKRYSDDVTSRERGGLIEVRRPDGTMTEWLRVGEEWIVKGVLEAAFEGEVGKVWPRVIASERGYFVVKVEERTDRPQ